MARRFTRDQLKAAVVAQAAGAVLTPEVQARLGTPRPRARTAPCPDCSGSGDVEEAGEPMIIRDCARCEGSGLVTAPPEAGQGTIFERTAAWLEVERAQYLLNTAVREAARLEFADERPLTAAFNDYQRCSEDYNQHGAALWWRERECQLNVNLHAGNVPDLLSLVRELHAALAEYRRIGGAPDRAPGVGGLS